MSDLRQQTFIINLGRRGPIQTRRKKFENTGFILRLGVPSTPRHENGAFRKLSSTAGGILQHRLSVLV